MTPYPHQEVVGFDVAMDEVLIVDVSKIVMNISFSFYTSKHHSLNSSDHLISQHKNSLHGKSS